MKITYPECQVEITAEEFITVIDHFTTKVTCNTEPIFEPGGIVGTGDDMPEPKPYPNMLDNEAIIPRGSGFQDLIMQGLKEAEAQGKLQGVQIPTEEEPAPTENKKEPAKRKTNSKKVQVLFETGWKTFSSISQAAKAIDARLNHISHALLNGKTCNGHQVRYATDDNEPTQPANEEQTELP
jgi:hypothetical protein